MFKYLLAIAVCLICLIVLQHGCQGIGERFRKRMDERREQRQHHWQDFREKRFDRFENFRDPEKNDSEEQRHIFRHRWRNRRKNSQDGNDDLNGEPILIEE